ncbi:MAG: S41 family peptidase [Alphaproteobacteria bacterium]|nr:S41 family peptidase [Alphaproteobacteria bacterium]MBV9370872.1 S41 family peptidase [Alphaproteobacteria bacterium]MBV9899662.1 S41 family peptidase [Alphaproteobacteria bacterium]
MDRMKTIAALLLAAAAGPAAAQDAPAGAPAQAPAPPRAEDVDVTAAEARATATELAGELEENYVFPDIAGRYAAALRKAAAAGAYDAIGSGRALAERLTADLRAVSPDNHLRVRLRPPAPERAPGAPSAQAAAAPPVPRLPFEPIEEARWLAPGIAYIRFNIFTGSPEEVAAVTRFMAEHAAAKTIIFDNRTHHGGGLDEMNAMFPYLFAKPTTLVMMDTRTSVARAGGDPVGEDARLRLVPTGEDVVRRAHYVEPSRTEKRLFRAKLFVLTSGATASAAEHMTLALKRTHRATIVGEPTAGAGHYGGQVTIGDKFVVFIPVGRTFDPDTGKGWEGDGIAPDVAVPAAEALTEALVRAGLGRDEATRISAGVKPTGSMARRTPRPS